LHVVLDRRPSTIVGTAWVDVPGGARYRVAYPLPGASARCVAIELNRLLGSRLGSPIPWCGGEDSLLALIAWEGVQRDGRLLSFSRGAALRLLNDDPKLGYAIARAFDAAEEAAALD
jgi:hypothetical protein